MRLTARRSDDDDVIRARLRALLADTRQPGGWVPPEEDPVDAPQETDDDPDGEDEFGAAVGQPSDGLPDGVGRHRAPGPTVRLDPGRTGARALWVAGLLAAVAVAGWTWLDRPAVEHVPDAVTTGPAAVASAAATTVPTPPTPPSGTVVVSVVGQVASPGLVTLPAGSRVADALAAAGGLLPEADPASVNGAAVLSDGQQIAVGVPGAAAPEAGPSAANAPDALLNLNRATVAELDALPGIGPVLAQRIVDHRTEHGPFTSVDQLDDVSGIGPAIYADLVSRVTV